MRTVGAVVLVVALGGCGLRYTGTQEQMQQVARGAAEMMKKDPSSDTVAAAGTGAHMALSAILGPEAETAQKPQVIGAFADETAVQREKYMELLRKRPSMYGGTADQGKKTSMKDFTGLPDNFHEETSIGKD